MINTDNTLLAFLDFCRCLSPRERVMIVAALGGPMTDCEMARLACVCRRVLYQPAYTSFLSALAARRPAVTKFRGRARRPIRSPDSRAFSNPDDPLA